MPAVVFPPNDSPPTAAIDYIATPFTDLNGNEWLYNSAKTTWYSYKDAADAKALYESNANTNAYDDAAAAKVAALRTTSSNEPIVLRFFSSDGATAIAADSELKFFIPHGKTITKATVITKGGTGSCVIELWVIAGYANTPTIANKITGAAPITVSSGTSSQDATLTGWSPTIAAESVGIAHINSSSVFTMIEIVLETTLTT